LGWLAATFTEIAPQSALYYGDFPAFFSAGSIILQGRGALLYSAAAQNYEQLAFGGYLPYAYPPWFGVIFSWLVPFGFFPAKAIWVLLMFLSSALAGRALVGHWDRVVTLGILLFPPLLHANIAGQNAALSLLGISVISKLLVIGRSDYRASIIGLSCGLLTYKPHYGAAAFLVSFMALPGHRAPLVLTFSAVVASAWGVSALISGSDWTSAYIEFVSQFAINDFEQNGFQMVSLSSLLGQLSGVAALIFSVAVALMVPKKFLGRSLGAILVLFSPHTLYYDLALLVPAFVLTFQRSDWARLWIIFSMATFFFIAAKGVVPGQVLTIFMALIFIYFLRRKELV